MHFYYTITSFPPLTYYYLYYEYIFNSRQPSTSLIIFINFPNKYLLCYCKVLNMVVYYYFVLITSHKYKDCALLHAIIGAQIPVLFQTVICCETDFVVSPTTIVSDAYILLSPLIIYSNEIMQMFKIKYSIKNPPRKLLQIELVPFHFTTTYSFLVAPNVHLSSELYT